ncbi:MAG: transporter related protein [Anaerocolumna sp.]|jgi:molybdate transport system ATP-binding protein|nr:transporter related protein [Anaerocolumna sp.]
MSLYVDIRKNFKDFHLDVKFHINGQRLGVLGPSGCGKSMTLKCIAGIEKPDQGIIILNDRVLFDSKKGIHIPPQKRNVGLLFQNYALFPNMSVRENIGIGIRNKSEKSKIINKMLILFRLQEIQNLYPSQLSGGQQQRVGIARILAYQPEILMLDEPFSALDSFLKEQLQQELFDVLNEYIKDVILVSHNRDELYHLSESLMVMEKGHIIAVGPTIDVFKNPGYVAAARLTGCKNIVRVKKVDDRTVFVMDWNVTLNTNTVIENTIQFIGIRAHDINIGFGPKQDNNMKVKLKGMTDKPFEKNIILSSSNGTDNNTIWWKVSIKDWEERLFRQIPDYIFIPKESILLLK